MTSTGNLRAPTGDQRIQFLNADGANSLGAEGGTSPAGGGGGQTGGLPRNPQAVDNQAGFSGPLQPADSGTPMDGASPPPRVSGLRRPFLTMRDDLRGGLARSLDDSGIEPARKRRRTSCPTDSDGFLADLEARIAGDQRQVLEACEGFILDVRDRLDSHLRMFLIDGEDHERLHKQLRELSDRIAALRSDAPSDMPMTTSERFEAVNQREDALRQLKELVLDVSSEIGFASVEKSLEGVLGRDWKWKISPDSMHLITSVGPFFTPTAHTTLSVDDLSEDCPVLVDEEGESYEASPGLLAGCADISHPMHMTPKSFVEHTHGAEFRIPVLNNGKADRVLVIHGYFDNDPFHAIRHSEPFKSKVAACEAAVAESAVSDRFKKTFLEQYPLRDLLLDTPEAFKNALEEADAELQRLKSDTYEEQVFDEFGSYDPAKQVRTMALLLMDPSLERDAVLFGELMGEHEPRYRDQLFSQLHATLQNKLGRSYEAFEQLRTEMQSLSKDDIPVETRILQSGLSPKGKAIALKKLRSGGGLMSMLGGDGDSQWVKTLIEIPFGKYAPLPVQATDDPEVRAAFLDKARGQLDTMVHGQEQAKEALMEAIGELLKNPDGAGKVFALVGPPGNGKTTFAKAIAKVLDRPFAMEALGGSADATTYLGIPSHYKDSKPGRLAEILTNSGVMNPVILFDELDKVSGTEKGAEIIGFLTHLTDPAGNDRIQDNYLSGIELDLSRAVIIFTLNDESRLNRVLKDRLKMIRTDPLTLSDKIAIANTHFIPSILASMNFGPEDITFEEAALKKLGEEYATGAGARRYNEYLHTILSQLNLEHLRGSLELPHVVTPAEIERIIKAPAIGFTRIPEQPLVGNVNGLYATQLGDGGITTIQVAETVGAQDEPLQLELTGSQGKVMKESMRAARTVAWNHLSEEQRRKIVKRPFGLHVHCPDTAQPKDGPSAGGAITVAIISHLTDTPVRNDVAMTGEIDIHGNITAIGGVHHKLRGAKRAGVKLALLPRDNAQDLEKVRNLDPELFDDGFEVHLVDTIDDLLKYALVSSNPTCK